MDGSQIAQELRDWIDQMRRDLPRAEAALASLEGSKPEPVPKRKQGPRLGHRQRRAAVKRELRRNGELTKQELAKKLDWPLGTTEKTIGRMRSDGELELHNRRYQLPRNARLDLGTSGHTSHPSDPDAEAIRNNLVHSTSE